MIICGFPGTGKSVMARYSKWVDLESTPFKKNWRLYAEVARHLSDHGCTVMVSTHAELLDELEQIEARYTVIVPDTTDIQTYMHRFEERGNSPEFCKLIYDNWHAWLGSIINRHTAYQTLVILPKDGCIQAWAAGMRKAWLGV